MHLMSSMGADAKKWTLYASTKGKAEQQVRDLDFPSFSVYRPGLLMCERQQNRSLEGAMRWVAKKCDSSGSWSIKTSEVAKAMVEKSLAVPAEPFTVLEHAAIMELGKERA